MRKRDIALIIFIICLPIACIGMIVDGTEKYNVTQIICGICLLFCIFIAFIGAYSTYKKAKKNLTPKEQRQRTIAFIKKHSKAFLAWSIVSALCAIISLVLLIIFVKYDTAFIVLLNCMFFFAMIFITLFGSYMSIKWENKKNKAIGKAKYIGDVVHGNIVDEEKQNTEEWQKYKAEQELREQKERDREQKSMNNLNNAKYVLTEKYSQFVFSYIEKITQLYSILFLSMFNDTETPMSSILVKPYSSTWSHLLKEKILFDGLQFTESKNQELSKQMQELTDVFIRGLRKRIQENNDYDTEDNTFPVLIYYIIRNNVIKHYYDLWLENYGYDNLEDFCINNRDSIKDVDITKFTYYYIYKKDINLPFVKTYLKSFEEVKEILKELKQKELENDLFENPQKKTIKNDAHSTTLSTIDRIDRMTGVQFEIFMEDYFKKQGFKVTRTPLSGDYGIDLIIENDFSKIGVQVKCYKNKVDISAIQQAVAGLRHYGLSSGMVVTNSTFQPSAIQLAKENNIMLWNRNKLISKLDK